MKSFNLLTWRCGKCFTKRKAKVCKFPFFRTLNGSFIPLDEVFLGNVYCLGKAEVYFAPRCQILFCSQFSFCCLSSFRFQHRQQRYTWGHVDCIFKYRVVKYKPLDSCQFILSMNKQIMKERKKDCVLPRACGSLL